MDELILEEAQEEVAEEQEFNLATVGAVRSSGVTLIFEGQDAASEKIYHCNSDVRLVAGDRVRVKKDSGTYLVEFAIGDPMSRYPIPPGGTTGQILAKSSNDNYAVQWVNAPDNPLPTGGTTGQVLAKKSNTNYDVEWVTPRGIPSGGSSGQILAKSSNSDYAVGWITAPVGLPTGGSTGQVLAKSSSTNYAVEWTTPSAAQIKNGSYTLAMSSTGILEPSSTNVDLGSSSKSFGDLYAQGIVSLGNSYSGSVRICAASGSTLGFFGHTPASRQTVASTATVATLITALKAYGLIN